MIFPENMTPEERKALAAKQGGWGPGPTQAEKDAQRAKLVRQAIEAIAAESDVANWWIGIAERERDAVLAKLARLLKHAS